MNVSKFNVILSGLFLMSFLTINASEKDVLLKKLRSGKGGCLKGKNIIITCKKAPNKDVPSFGLGDGFLYLRVLTEYLETKYKANVSVVPPKPLVKFFNLCSNIKIANEGDKKENTIIVDCVELLDNIDGLENFESKKRFLDKTKLWANREVNDLVEVFKKLNKIPVIVTRQSAHYKFKSKEEEKTMAYLNERSISREKLAKILKKKPEHIEVFNMQFEDQKELDIENTKKPVTVYPSYNKRAGAFVRDAILLKAALKAGGQIVSIDTAAAMLAIGVPEAEDKRKNIIILLGKAHNSRWKKPFLKKDGSVSWSKNVLFLVQKKRKDWSAVGKMLNKIWSSLKKKES